MLVEIQIDCHEDLVPDVLCKIALAVAQSGKQELSGSGMVNNTGFRWGLSILDNRREHKPLLGYCDADSIHKGRAARHIEMETCLNWYPIKE